jgi:hypothetical protein
LPAQSQVAVQVGEHLGAAMGLPAQSQVAVQVGEHLATAIAFPEQSQVSVQVGEHFFASAALRASSARSFRSSDFFFASSFFRCSSAFLSSAAWAGPTGMMASTMPAASPNARRPFMARTLLKKRLAQSAAILIQLDETKRAAH